jgi:hypothetical protein
MAKMHFHSSKAMRPSTIKFLGKHFGMKVKSGGATKTTKKSPRGRRP